MEGVTQRRLSVHFEPSVDSEVNDRASSTGRQETCTGSSSLHSMTRSEVAPSRTPIGRRLLYLQFEDPLVEAEYAESINVLNRRSLLKFLMVPIPVIIVEGLHYILMVFTLDHPVHIFTLSARIIFFLMTVLALALTYWSKTVKCETLATVWAVFATLVLVPLGTHRMGMFMGCYEEVIAHLAERNMVVFNDVGTLLAFQMIGYATLVFVRVRTCTSWKLPAIQTLIYIGLTLPRWMDLTIFNKFLNIFLFSVLNVLIWIGCYKTELLARERWSESRALRREVLRERTLNEMHKKLLAEVSERLEALRAVTGEAITPPAPIASQKSLAEKQRGQVPPPALLVPSIDSARAPNEILTAALATSTANRARLRSMASRIREEKYGMEEFFQDALATFPELSLFHSVAQADADATGGRSMEDEYQRTVGALFAVYWLLRLDSDGKHGWCFGVDKSWQAFRGSPDQNLKRESFFVDADWASFGQLVGSAVCSSLERVEAMLCLTAFHDIMKIPELCPKVSSEHAPYRGYSAGATINDHDLALAYVLEHFPDVLPSFRILPAETRRVVIFTQGKMEFNHGWFVQAEAPPGAMLRQLRSVLSNAHANDLAFYFLHWLTDLSGAEGRPLAGAEKFVLKFPIRVLGEFMWSIPFLQGLLDKTEVAVMEDYLHAMWARNFPELPLPSGHSSVALLRIAVMAQGNAALAIEQFNCLSPACQEVLSTELARTGVEGQRYQGTRTGAGGPAFLVYYGPALLQHCANAEEVQRALQYLAGVLAAGRALWPLSRAKEGQTVKLEIGKMVHAGKEPKQEDAVWALLPQNALEGKVDAVEPAKVNEMNITSQRYWLIDISCDPPRRRGSLHGDDTRSAELSL